MEKLLERLEQRMKYKKKIYVQHEQMWIPMWCLHNILAHERAKNKENSISRIYFLVWFKIKDYKIYEKLCVLMEDYFYQILLLEVEWRDLKNTDLFKMYKLCIKWLLKDQNTSPIDESIRRMLFLS